MSHAVTGSQYSGEPTWPTQFALVPIDRVIFLIQRYEGLRLDAESLPPDPSRPPIGYVERTLSELRRELVAREGEAAAA